MKPFVNYFEYIQIVLRFISYVAAPIQWFLSRDSRCVEKTQDPILKYSIDQLRTKIQSKEISCETVVKTYIKQIKKVNPGINAVVDDRYVKAIEEAKEFDRLTESGQAIELPLFGIPFTVKQIIAVEGLSCRVGSLHQPEDIAYQIDAEVVQRLRKAGGIPLLISNTPELSVGYETYNHVTGTTKNPFDFSRSAGGSSGGEAALIASDCTVFGIGTDTAGSIRLPCHFNGVYGHKPTPGLIPKTNIYPIFEEPLLHKYNVVGPLAKNVADLKIVFKILCGDSVALNLNENVDDIKILYAKHLTPRVIMANVDAEIQDRIQWIVDSLSKKKFDIREFNAEKFYYLPEVTTHKLLPMCKYPYFLQRNPSYVPGASKKATKERWPPLWKEGIKCMFCCSKFTFSLVYFEFVRRWKGTLFGSRKLWNTVSEDMEQDFIKLLSDNTVLILPTFPSPAVNHSCTFLRPVDATYMTIANSFGLPATQIPIGYNSKGLPFGIQIIGGPKMDSLTLQIAEEIENLIK